MENVAEKTLADKYAHIKGWGIDADPENEPTYPIKHWTGDDHKRINWKRPPLQPVNIEVLHSIERPNITAVFGTSSPPSGLSGAIRRYAFKYSEGNYAHWFALVLADRVNMVEGIIDDIAHGHFPNFFKERGWTAEWKYNRKAMITKLAIGAGVLIGVAAFLYARGGKKKSLL
ncbi:MAG: hypothetical protein J7578_18325 [Chitinophagaceae bacterium]|nr:hypothetical protein [Chitinophagaceae bacterium]